jgi:hypothetical protein
MFSGKGGEEGSQEAPSAPPAGEQKPGMPGGTL